VLGGLDVTLERVRAEVAHIVGPGEEATAGQIPFTPRAKKVLELALREAQSLGDNYIGTEHLLLGLVREDSGVASSILLDLGADAGQVRTAVGRVLGGPSGRLTPQTLAARRPPSNWPIDWRRAQLLWRPEGVELRVPLRLEPAAMARFAADEIWSAAPFAALRRELWSGWVALASPTLLDDVDPHELRRALGAAVARASAEPSTRVAEFLRALRAEPDD
jgi:hypothetical protein